MRAPRHGRGRVVNVLAAPLPRLLRGGRARRMGRALPWPVLSLVGFLALIIAGTALLSLPLTTQGEGRASVTDAAFTAVSAVTVTGLTVVDTAGQWNRVGEGVVLGLVQLGGLGIMTSTTFFLVLLGTRIGIRGRALAREDLASPSLAAVRRFVLSIVLFTVVAEAAGFGLLYIHFGRSGPGDEGLWQAGFHAVSAFNNAGFDLLGERGFRQFQSTTWLLLVVAALVIAGGISFSVVANILSVRGFRRLSLNSKVVLAATLLLLAAGFAFVLGTEHGNEATLGPLPWTQRLSSAFFQSVTSRTAGFSTLPTGALLEASLFFIIVLMFIGAAAGSTGGGIKVNTLAVLVSGVVSSLRGRPRNEAFERRIPDEQLRKALTLASLALCLVFTAAMVLIATEGLRFLHSLFLVVSAFATVGLSPVDPSGFTLGGKVLLMAVMVAGKLGSPLLILLLARLDRPSRYDYPEERVNLA